MLTTVPLVGCIGQDDGAAPDQQATDDVTDPAPSLGQQALLHRATANGSDLVAGDTMPGGLPLPLGLDRVIDHSLFEPSIGATSDGTLFVSNLEGAAVTDYSSILRSTDQGQTWEDVTGSIGPISSPPQSNDPYVYVDQATDRVYNLDMQGLQCNYIRWSDDNGDSWTANPLGCGQPPVLDHPTLFSGPPNELSTVGYENVVYLCVNRVGDSACATSLDGGLTWAGFITVYPGVNAEGELCGGLHAHGTTGPDGRAYLPKGQCGTPMVAYSDDDGVTWQTVAISEDVEADGHEVAIATDEAGNVYAFWITPELEPVLAVSTDRGESWSDPIDVAPPGVAIADKPTIAAGAEGRIAMAYVGTSDDADAYEDVAENATWNAYMTTVVDATSPDPTIATVTANPPEDPIARGVCGGTRCPGESGGYLGDFIDVTIGPDGRPWAAFVDVCTEDCVTDPSAGNDVGVGFLGTLDQGPRLSGPASALTPLTDRAPSNG